ncbi:hypothetical protein [Planotetraspora silvatica]|uniref:hypothetical protein n=1 Tax=Planotetraspora silvatica TaxID=234614 RepID=UPI0019519945|nr:hypothetical protein [Planotetraspora silvatica]
MQFKIMHRYWVAAMLSAGLALGGCGSGGGGGAAPSASSTLTDAQIQSVVNELVQCIRSNGAPGLPDVKAENGRVVLPDETTVDEATKRNLAAAAEACKSIQERLPASVFEKPGQDGDQQRKPTAEDVPVLREWSRCIREHGVSEWPDPKPDGSFPLDNAAIKEGKSARIVAAWQACEQYWNGGMERS